MRNIIKGNKGITLTALVITIIIMVIIAGVTVSITVGEGGLIDKSRNEVAKYDAEVTRKTLNLAVLTATMTGNGTVTVDNLTKALNDQFGDGNYTLSVNADPIGFRITIGTLEFITDLKGEVTEVNNP